MIKRFVIFISLLSLALDVLAWAPWPLPMDSIDNNRDTLYYNGEFAAHVASNKYAPFWLYTNTYGVVSEQPMATHLMLAMDKPAVRGSRWWDYSYGVQIMGGRDVVQWRYQFVETYAHLRLWCFDVTAGIKPEMWGNQDMDLSAGGMLFSKNAPASPRISIGIDKYTAFPFTYGYLELKGGITHGWFLNSICTKNTLLHHKFIAFRLGGKLPVNINYEFHHAAQWGGISPEYGNLGNSISDLWKIFSAQSGGNLATDQINALGNHIGSQMVGVDFKLKGWKTHLYWQNIFEDGPILPIWSTMNVADGLWGLSVQQNHWRFISKLVYEFVNTTDQSGPCHDIDGVVFGGSDDYFINSLYRQGWSHRGLTIGNPFITSPLYYDSSFTLNNRVMVHHLALAGDIYNYGYTLHVSHAQNYGRYRGLNRSSNTALGLVVQHTEPRAWNLNFKLTFAADIGSQFGNNFGVMLTVAKRGIVYTSRK